MIEMLVTAVVVLLLILMQGFFSGSEIALVSSDKSRLKHQAKKGRSGSALALKMFERPEVILTTTLIGTNIALVVSSVLGTTLMIHIFGEIGGLLAIIVLTPLTLLFGEVIPKSVFQQESDKLTPRIIYPLYAVSILFYPIVFVFSRIARLIARRVGSGKPGAAMFAVREQLRAVLEASEGASPEEPIDRLRIRNVVRLGELVAGDVMIPASEMVAIDATDDIAAAINLVRRTGLNFFPTYDGERNNIIGMAHLAVWDLVDPAFKDKTIADVTSPACFVPVVQPAAELLPILRSRQDETAIVVDEYGSPVGLVDVRMILESVVAKADAGIADASRPGNAQTGYTELGEDEYLLDARMPIADVNDLLAINISTATAHSVGGLMIARLRRVPRTGDSITEQGFTFTVEEASERAATRLRVSRG